MRQRKSRTRDPHSPVLYPRLMSRRLDLVAISKRVIIRGPDKTATQRTIRPGRS